MDSQKAGKWWSGGRNLREVHATACIRLPLQVFRVGVSVVSAATDFHADDADQWVQVERYLQGEIVEIGGLKKSMPTFVCRWHSDSGGIGP